MATKEITSVFGYQQITSLSSAASLTVPQKDVTGQNGSARAALIQTESQAVRWRDDGTAPTASVGMRLLVGENLWYDGDLNKIKFIEETASAKLNVSYYA